MNDYSELLRTAELVRAEPSVETASIRPFPRLAAPVVLVGLGLILAASMMARPSALSAAPVSASDNASLFQLTNQDRASNGVPAVSENGTLDGIAGGTPYAVCGISVPGRSQDMINRNYFSHQIPPCNVYVFTMMQEAHIAYRSAGENIGWESYASDPASYVNNAFMNSPDHRSNILDASYTSLGIGSAYAGSWSGAGKATADVTMFSEEFAQLGNANPIQPGGPLPALPPRNTPAPVAISLPPLPTNAAPARVQPTPSAPPIVFGAGNSPLIWYSSGLLSDSVESVLEGYLVN